MKNRTLFLLLALACWAVMLLTFAYARAVRGDQSTAKFLAKCTYLAGIGFLIAAFKKERIRIIDYYHDEHTSFSCPNCQVPLNYSLFPAFEEEFLCPKCRHTLKLEGGEVLRELQLDFIRSPEVAYELAAGDGSPPSGPVTAEAVRAALEAETAFTVEYDPDGWLVLTAIGGRSRWVNGPTPGTVVGEMERARLKLLPVGDISAIRPECVALISTETNLTANVCVALSSALGPLHVRIRGADDWIAVDRTGGPVFFAQLSMQRPLALD